MHFPLKAAYQGWLDEASSDLIPAYQTEAQRLLGRSLDGPEAEQAISRHAELPQSVFGWRAEFHREVMRGMPDMQYAVSRKTRR